MSLLPSGSVRTCLVVLGVLAAGGAAYAQPGSGNVITSANAFFSMADVAGGTTGTGTVTTFSANGPAGHNNLGNAWWWGRLEGGDPREFAIAVTNAVSTFSNVKSPDTFTQQYFYNRVVAGGAVVPTMRVELTWQVIGLGTDLSGRSYARLIETATVTNLTGSGANNPATTFTYNLFNYNNFAAFGTNNNKTAVQINPTTIRLLDGADPFNRLDYQAIGPSPIMQVTTTTASASVRNLLTNSIVNNLASSIAAGPANLEIGTEFTFTLAAGQSQTASVQLLVPSPGALALMGLGGLLVTRRRRRF